MTSSGNHSLELSLYNYSLELDGQFTNTKFDYNFKLTCDFPTVDYATVIDLQFYSILNAYNQVMPQVSVRDIKAPLTTDNCKIELVGGIVSEVVEAFIRNF